MPCPKAPRLGEFECIYNSTSVSVILCGLCDIIDVSVLGL